MVRASEHGVVGLYVGNLCMYVEMFSLRVVMVLSYASRKEFVPSWVSVYASVCVCVHAHVCEQYCIAMNDSQ